MAKALEQRDGVEVSVETGLGIVVKVDDPKGRNAQVTIQAPHLRIPVTSWVDTANLKLYTRVLDACREGYRIGYTICIHRKADQDRSVPLADIPTLGRVRDLEEVIRVAGDTPQGAPAAPQEPSSSDRPATPPPDAPGPQEQPQGPVCGLCGGGLAGTAARRVQGVLQHQECPDGSGSGPLNDGAETGTDPSPAYPHDAPPAEPSSSPATATRAPRPRVQEARPWEYSNSDGSLNLGNYAVQAAEGIVLLAQELLLEHTRRLEGPSTPPTLGQIKGLARRLLMAADMVQSDIREDGHVVRMASSHSRARSAVRAALPAYPVPFGASADKLDDWVLQLAEHASGILKLSIALIDTELDR